MNEYLKRCATGAGLGPLRSAVEEYVGDYLSEVGKMNPFQDACNSKSEEFWRRMEKVEQQLTLTRCQ